MEGRARPHQEDKARLMELIKQHGQQSLSFFFFFRALVLLPLFLLSLTQSLLLFLLGQSEVLRFHPSQKRQRKSSERERDLSSLCFFLLHFFLSTIGRFPSSLEAFTSFSHFLSFLGDPPFSLFQVDQGFLSLSLRPSLSLSVCISAYLSAYLSVAVWLRGCICLSFSRPSKRISSEWSAAARGKERKREDGETQMNQLLSALSLALLSVFSSLFVSFFLPFLFPRSSSFFHLLRCPVSSFSLSSFFFLFFFFSLS